MGNAIMTAARMNKNDEFYTRYEDVENEMRHYDFSGMRVMCNCDDPEWSAFYKYFNGNYERLGLAGLTCTHKTFDGQPSYALVRDGEGTRHIRLTRDGDFRDMEVARLMRECDIVVTNPPFSLWRVFIDLLLDNGMKFLILGAMPNGTYKNIVTLLRTGAIHTGFERAELFGTPDGSVSKVSCRWYTNLDTLPPCRPLTLTRRYSPEEYARIYGLKFDAINVDRLEDIPVDYTGVMGVPITFVINNYWNPDEWELIAFTSENWVRTAPDDAMAEFNRQCDGEYLDGSRQSRKAYTYANMKLVREPDGRLRDLFDRALIRRRSTANEPIAEPSDCRQELDWED